MDAVDVAVVGGGPIGLAAALACAARGLSVTVFERQPGIPDKACGEGLMPAGLRALELLGARALLDPSFCAPLSGIRWIQEDGTAVEGRFREGEGMGIRRLGLMDALHAAARKTNIAIHRGACVHAVIPELDTVRIEVDGSTLRARFLVAADGLHSPLRHALGLEGMPCAAPRLGLRRHYRGLAPGAFVEVHWSPGAECYLTPTGPERLGVAFLFDARIAADFEALLARFPLVQARLRGAEPDSALRGAGPLRQLPRAVTHGRVALVGDAAGYLDALTGEGLSLGFASAEALAGAISEALVHGPERLDVYRRAHARLFRSHVRTAGGLVWLARNIALRRAMLRALARAPALFDLALRAAE